MYPWSFWFWSVASLGGGVYLPGSDWISNLTCKPNCCVDSAQHVETEDPTIIGLNTVIPAATCKFWFFDAQTWKGVARSQNCTILRVELRVWLTCSYHLSSLHIICNLTIEFPFFIIHIFNQKSQNYINRKKSQIHSLYPNIFFIYIYIKGVS